MSTAKMKVGRVIAMALGVAKGLIGIEPTSRLLSTPTRLVWDVPFCAASSTLCLHPPIAGEIAAAHIEPGMRPIHPSVLWGALHRALEVLRNG